MTDAMEALLGTSLLDKNALVRTKEVFQNKEFVLLYFSASWCPPCRAFTPILSKFYKKHAVAQNLEIVYISSDRSLEEFNEYYGKMPWKAVPTDAAQIKQTLASRLGIQGIPALVVLEVSTGLFVTNDIRDQIQRNAEKDGKVVKSMINEWKEKDAVTLEEGAKLGNRSSILSVFWRIVFTILKNPAYIFGLLYLYKVGMRQLRGNDSPEETKEL